MQTTRSSDPWRQEKQFSHRVSLDLLKAARKSTMEQRLRWLEEMQNFIRAAVPIEKWKRWQEYKGR